MAEPALRHVLVVEDDAGFRRFIIRALAESGFRVSAAENFASAMEILERPDLVHLLISDVGLGAGMPHGITLGNMAQFKQASLKVIYISGSYAPETVNQFGRPVAVLQKPFTAQTLLAAVKASLDGPLAAGA